MPRIIKTSSKLYAYLNERGLLNGSTSNDIERAKKEFWAQVRREWKRIHRKEHKTYSVSFAPKELQGVLKKAEEMHSSAANFIKKSALAFANNQFLIDTNARGVLRAAILSHRDSVENYFNSEICKEQVKIEFLNEIDLIEEKFYSLLKIH